LAPGIDADHVTEPPLRESYLGRTVASVRNLRSRALVRLAALMSDEQKARGSS